MPHRFSDCVGNVLRKDMSGGVGDWRTVYRSGAKVTGREDMNCSTALCVGSTVE